MKEEDYEIPMFDFQTFKKEFSCGDLSGLDYIEKTIIRDFKDRINDNIDLYTRYDYIIALFYATRELNECVFIYESTKVENNFNYDLYCEVRDLLFKELGNDFGFKLEDIYEEV